MKKNIFCVDQVLIIAKTSQSENSVPNKLAKEATFELTFGIKETICFLCDVSAVMTNACVSKSHILFLANLTNIQS